MDTTIIAGTAGKFGKPSVSSDSPWLLMKTARITNNTLAIGMTVFAMMAFISFLLCRKSPEPRTEIAGVERGHFEIHRVSDTGHQDEAAVRHCRGHHMKIGGRDPAVPFAPQYQVRMPDLRHAALQLPALTLARKIDGCPNPDAFGNAKGLFDDPVEQRLDVRAPWTELRDPIRRHAFRHEQR